MTRKCKLINWIKETPLKKKINFYKEYCVNIRSIHREAYRKTKKLISK